MSITWWLIENIILSNPYEDFRKEHLWKHNRYLITTIIERAREYEAIKASMASLTGIKFTPNTHTLNAIIIIIIIIIIIMFQNSSCSVHS